MKDVDNMKGNLRFGTKGIGGLYDTFRVVNRRKTDIYKEPVLETVTIIDKVGQKAETQNMRKRKLVGGRMKTSYKKQLITKKRALTSSRRKSNKVGKTRIPSRKQTLKQRRRKNQKSVKRVKDRF